MRLTVALFALSSLALACGKSESGRANGRGPDVGGSGSHSGGTKGDGSGAGGPDAELSRVELEGAPLYTRIQRLTNRQWEHAVTDILGFREVQGLSASFAGPLTGTSDFDNNERMLQVGPESFRDFETGAEAAAKLATGTAEALDDLRRGYDPQDFVHSLGRRAFRRPLTTEEGQKYEAVFALGESLYGSEFANGAALVIRALLQSPHFLYRTELGPSGEPLNGYELASKLSFWLLGTTPSDELLDAAAAGELDRDEGVEAIARQMLEDPRALETMRDFHAQLVGARRYEAIDKPGVADAAALRRELVLASDAFFTRVFREGLGLNEIFTSGQAYVGPALAPLYGLAPPSSALELRELGPSRAGYFMQVPFLLSWGDGEQSDPIHRGSQLQKLSCGPMSSIAQKPPLPLLEPGETNRQRTSRVSEQCGGTCHAVYIDPLGFALERFDGLGRERERDNGQPIDTSGTYPFAEGVAAFADGKELMQVMANSLQVHTCYAKKLTSYALGRDLVERDRSLLESLADVSLNESLKELALSLVRAPAFRTRQEGLP